MVLWRASGLCGRRVLVLFVGAACMWDKRPVCVITVLCMRRRWMVVFFERARRVQKFDAAADGAHRAK